MVVVAVQPVGRHVTHFLRGLEDVAVEHLGAVGLVESFDIGVLRRLSRLDVIEGDFFGFRPFGQGVSDEFRAVVQANRQRRTAYIHQLVQRPYDARSRQAGVNFDAQTFAVELVDDVEGPESPAGPQRVGHEVAAPALVGLTGRLQGLLDACWQPLLAASWQVQSKLAVHAPEHRFASGLALVASAVVQQAKAVAWVERHVRLDEG